jgi:hypothetical protein
MMPANTPLTSSRRRLLFEGSNFPASSGVRRRIFPG